MPSLYQLTHDLEQLQLLLEDGIIDDAIFNDTVEGLDIEGKVEGICMVMKNLEHQAEAYKAEIDRMTARKRTLENGIARLKNSLMHYMNVSCNRKVEAGLFTVSLGSSKSVSIVNERLIPSAYLVEQSPKVDKTAISKALKAGETVEGVELVENQHVVIR